MQKVLVLGKGKSGIASEKLLKEKGFDVCLVNTDEFVPDEDFKFVVISPGIDKNHPFVLKTTKGIELISEMELALRFSTCKLIGVTGTNGKSTLCTFLGHMFSAPVCGNIGLPACDVLPYLKEEKWAIVELSSFQLELMCSKRFDVGVLLEITEDHLDRHKDFEEYKSAKLHLKDLVKDKGLFLQDQVGGFGGSKLFTSSVFEILEIIEKNVGGSISKAEAEFKPLEHRLEFAGEKDGIIFVNDSKATTPVSTVFAVSRVGGSIILLVGGKDKNSDFSLWNKSLSGKVKAIICFGAAKEKIKKSLQSNFVVYTVNKMEEAILKGLSLVSKGDTLLLSPGCTSFDEFSNFEQRGDVFKREVLK